MEHIQIEQAEERRVTGEGDSEQSHSMSDVDHPAAFAQIREQLADLDASIESLRGEADRLLESASARNALAVLDPPMRTTTAMSELETSLAELGRHSADIPDEFDPAPFDPDEVDEDDGIPGAFDGLAAAPAFADDLDVDVDEKLPPVDVDVKPRALLEQKPEPPAFGTDAESESSDEARREATVLEFAPRSTRPAEKLDVPSTTPGTDRSERSEANESAFGAMPSSGTEEESPDTVNRGSGTDDGLDAIAGSESTEVPRDWDQHGDPEEAFEKFFSADIEPEPAQRWLLSE